jgi:hypothetical protein
MKNKGILLPIDYSNAIDLDSIDVFTKGIILVYKENKIKGVIMHSSYHNTWNFCQTINFMDFPDYTSDSLLGLISNLMKTNLADDFEFIAF